MSNNDGFQNPKKKLIEVALPLQAVNRGCEEDKNRKTGHIRNLHKWFAPMPLPSWRAMLFASLVDDPGESLPKKEADRERAKLLQLIERLSTFEAHNDDLLLGEVRQEIWKAVGAAPPVIVDPFCGGGSTILEAQRLGLATQASDLNPVPVLITTVLCRIPSLFRNQGPISRSDSPGLLGGLTGLHGLKTDVVHYANRLRQLAFSSLAQFYPSFQGATPFAYRWAWTVASPDPASKGGHTPLVSNWWMSRHKSSRAWIQPVRQNNHTIMFRVKTEGEPGRATTGRSGAICLVSQNETPIGLDYIREQGRLGKLRQTMFGIAARANDRTIYTVPDEQQVTAASSVHARDVPGILMPEAALGFRVQQYGISNFLDLFTKRQALALHTFAQLVANIRDEIERDAIAVGMKDDRIPLEQNGFGAAAYADAIAAILGLCVGKMAQSNNILVRWFIDPRNGSGKATPAFDRHAIPMVWDFVETNPFGGSVGDWTGPVLETALRAFDLCAPSASPALVLQEDARRVADDMTGPFMVATDPPYYSNIGYADLSDFFYLWLREALKPVFPKLLATMGTPKDDELIATPYRHQGSIDRANQYFRTGFGQVFGGLAKKADPRFPMLIVYAIKQSEEEDEAVGSTGWEVFLGGLVDAGIAVVATWPVRTTTDTRMISLGNNALASAIFVVCRGRAADAPTVTRRDFLATLKAELPIALRNLQAGNILPVDLAQAAIGPGMAVYTRYTKVLDADGSTLSVHDALTIIIRP